MPSRFQTMKWAASELLTQSTAWILLAVLLADALEDALAAGALHAHGNAGIFRLEGLGDALGDGQVDRGVPGDLAFLLGGLDQLRRDAAGRRRGGRTRVLRKGPAAAAAERPCMTCRREIRFAMCFLPCRRLAGQRPAFVRWQAEPHRRAGRVIVLRRCRDAHLGAVLGRNDIVPRAAEKDVAHDRARQRIHDLQGLAA